MNRLFFAGLILLCVIVASCQSHKKALSKRIFNKHKIFVKPYAQYVKWERDVIFEKYLSNLIPSDTLFLIERIGEPSLLIWGNIWTSKRDLVYEYERESQTVKDTVLNYQSWNNRYKTNVEKFDTTTLDKQTMLGGLRTFITQVIRGKEVKTFYFVDEYSTITGSTFYQQTYKLYNLGPKK